MPRTLLSIYPNSPNRYDEMLDVDGRVRPHWERLFKRLDATSPEVMRQRLDFLERRIQENGVTYNVYADQGGADRPWALDPLPLILSASEWDGISRAVAQRAQVINDAIGDLYGPQNLLAEGLVPPALVFGQHGFLWPCTGIRPPGGTYLHMYAVDLARSPDGRWWVIADRTQAPSGTGYALENRIIISRVFPELFRDLRVQHLAYFFRALQDSLAQWAPVAPGEQPHVVLLTPGPYNETYFEHAYLARYLGFPLVEGQDLTVRGDKVYLKTLSGLKRVHAILRRQDDAYCDPLELRGDSALGVPGLLQAVRSGQVMVANALGSGILGSGALMGFLPGICERLRGEPLAMPSVATWWCGEEPALEYVIEHLDDLVIKGAYPTQRFETLFGRELKGEARAEMIRRLRARPHAYVAQELVNLSQAPIWSRTHDRRLLARSVGLRVYAVATPDGYLVMPGGLARVAGGPNALVISMQRGGASKDTWVLAEGQVNTFTMLKSSLTTRDLVHGGSNLTSRVVESLFWLGRYSERFDDTARLLRVALLRLMDVASDVLPPELEALLDLCQQTGVLKSNEAAGGDDEAEAEVPLESRLLAAVYDGDQVGSLAASIRSASWAATQVRERMSLDHWHSINSLQRSLQASRQQVQTVRDANLFLDQVLQVSSSLNGFVMDNMTRDDGWRFLVVGRRIERLAFLANSIGHFLTAQSKRGPSGLEWLLELTDSIITYRSRYSRQPELLPVLDLIVFDDSNPHSVLFQLLVIQNYLKRLQRGLGGVPVELLQPWLDRLESVDLSRFEGIGRCECDPCRTCGELANLLASLVGAAHELSDQMGMRYFTHVSDIGRQTLAS
jgi:uncharacterized circularly permuted ATP-grasp superfamily protein/uncharacterized alpha-E superfamily protein